MFDRPIPQSELHEFLNANYEALQNAALLLGGRSWLLRVQKMLDAFTFAAEPTYRNRIELTKLYRLLTMQFVHPIDGLEAAYYADLDPTQPEIEEICLLADGLAHAMEDAGIDLTEHFATNDSFDGWQE